MKRKLILLGGTFLVVLAVVLAYELLIPRVIYETPNTADNAHPNKIPGKSGGVTGPDSPWGKKLEIIETEPQESGGRLKRRYYVESWEKNDEGVYLLEDARVTLYQKDGQQINITAKTGEVVAEWIEGKPKVISGFLAGDVKIFIDRTRDFRRRESLPPEERSEVVRIYTEKLSFSNPDLKIHTDLPIKLYSKEGDIFGEGLVLSWSENPRELRELKIIRGQKMIVHNAGGKSQVLMTPGQKSDAAEPEPAGTDQPPDLVTTADIAATQPSSAGMKSNVFVANFYADKKDVHVHSGENRMEGARKLSLTFEFEPSSSALTPEEIEPEPEGVVGPVDPGEFRADPIDVPAGDESTAPPIPLPDIAKPDTAPAEVVAASRPATASQPKDSKEVKPLIIEWDGPLVLVPKGHTPKPSRKRYNIVATGRTVTLSDESNTASCADFQYDNLLQVGTLKGSEDRPAKLVTEQNEEIVSQVIKFNRAKGQADLVGKGYMIRHVSHRIAEGPTSRPTTNPITRPVTRPATEPASRPSTRPATEPASRPSTRPATEPASRPATRPTTEPASQPATKPAEKLDKIEWTESVLAVFGADPETGRQYIKETTFKGDVELRQGKTDDYVKCDTLYVKMERTASGKVQPTEAIATGNAKASQEGSMIGADEITVTFTEAPDAEDDPDQRVSGRVKPTELTAVGNVKVRDDRGKEPVTASADKLESNIIKRSAVLTGTDPMANLTQGDNTLSGARIELSQKRSPSDDSGDGSAETQHFAKVIGPGFMKFKTDKDLNGRTLDDATPIRISWSKGMDYHPKDVVGGIARAHSAADFKGDVTVDSGDDHMECWEMEALFVEPTKTPAPATTPVAPVALDGVRPGGTVTMANYSSRKLIKLTAKEKVVLTSLRTDPEGRLLRRVRLQGDNLVYNTLNGLVKMDKSGAMLAEDYRKPAPKARDDDTQRLERPMLTLFKWDDSMELSQKERVVIMKGKVAMVHRSGQYVLSEIKDLKVPDYGKDVPLGRKTNLTCDHMTARFEPPKKTQETKKPETGPSDPLDVGPKIGALKLFDAIGNVNLTDGGKQIVGQRLTYTRLKELVEVHGYLPDQPKADAMIIDKDRIRNTEKIVKSPRILWWRATKANGFREKIEADEVSVD